MNPLRKTFSLMTAGILTVVLTTVSVNADAAGRGSAEERNRRAGIPACNAAGTAHMSGEEAVARVFGKPVPQDLSSYDDIRVCNDAGFLRIVPPHLDSDLDRKIFNLGRSMYCLSSPLNGLVMLTETTPEDQAINTQKAISYGEIIKTSPQFEYLVDFVNKKHGQGTISSDTVHLLWVGSARTLRSPSLKICSTLSVPGLWDSTARPQEVAAAVGDIVEDHLSMLSVDDLITAEERKQLSQ